MNGTKYTVEIAKDIPDELRFKKRVVDFQKTKVDENVNKQDTAERDDGIEDMEVVPPQDISSQNFNNRNWDQAARTASNAPSDVEQAGAAHLTKRGLTFFTGKSYLSEFYLVEFKDR